MRNIQHTRSLFFHSRRFSWEYEACLGKSSHFKTKRAPFSVRSRDGWSAHRSHQRPHDSAPATSNRHRCAEIAFLQPFYSATNTIDLPRQARNKHTETLKQRGVFRRLCRLRPVGFEQCVSVHRGEKTALFAHILYKNDRLPRQARDKHRKNSSLRESPVLFQAPPSCGTAVAEMCKVPGVQGPMDDAFMAPFLVVTPDDATARERPALPCSVQHGFKTNESPVSLRVSA